ncbi:MAG: hypothetical protein WD451_15865 [Thermoanaerobaculia bacterium]
MTRPARLAVAGAIWLAAFAALFSIGSALDLWPAPPACGFRGVDLAAGFLFGLVLLWGLLRKPPLPTPASSAIECSSGGRG